MGTGASQLRLAIVVVAALLVYLIGNNTIGLWDRDEPRYAQCSRQMGMMGVLLSWIGCLATGCGDFVVERLTVKSPEFILGQVEGG